MVHSSEAPGGEQDERTRFWDLRESLLENIEAHNITHKIPRQQDILLHKYFLLVGCEIRGVNQTEHVQAIICQNKLVCQYAASGIEDCLNDRDDATTSINGPVRLAGNENKVHGGVGPRGVSNEQVARAVELKSVERVVDRVVAVDDAGAALGPVVVRRARERHHRSPRVHAPREQPGPDGAAQAPQGGEPARDVAGAGRVAAARHHVLRGVGVQRARAVTARQSLLPARRPARFVRRDLL